MKITSGEHQGFYYIEQPFTADNSLARNKTVYSRLRLNDGKTIQGFNRSYLPHINGYYYVPKNDDIDIRKLIYGLENNEIPSTGNTETFFREFEKNIIVPDNWCPEYLDPCEYDWCKKCETLKNLPPPINIPLTQTKRLKKTIYIFVFSVVVCCLAIYAIKS